MTKSARAPLPVTFLDGEEPVFPLDDNTFAHLEEAIGQKLDEDARGKLQLLCDRFLDDLRVEMAGEDYRDVLAQFSTFEAATSAMWKFAYETKGGTSAANERDDLVDKALHERPVGVFPQRGELVFLTADSEGWETFTERFVLPDAAYAVRIDIDFLRRLAMEMQISFNKAKLELDRRSKAARTRPRVSAEDKFLYELPKWAKRHDLPFGEYIKGTDPAPFSHFAASLLNLVPEKWWRSSRDTAIGAVAMQIKRARGRVKSLKKGKSQAA